MSNIFCGMDFGTTNTTAALINEKQIPTLVALENNNTTIPSALFFSNKEKIYFGREAMKMYIDGEIGRCMRSIKRILGSDLMSGGTIINNKKVSFISILEYFLQHIKNKIDSTAQTNVESIILGRPVHFCDNNEINDTKAENILRKIAQNIGFKNIEFQYEPIAAAFAHESKIEKEKLACVIDIGGGTSDFTIIKVGKNLMQKTNRKDDILASTGVRVGGNDFDKDLSLKCFMPLFGYQTKQTDSTNKIIDLPMTPFRTMAEWSSINSMYNYKELDFAEQMLYNSIEKDKVKRFVELIEKELGYLLLNTVENTKINLSQEDCISLSLDFVSDKPTIQATAKGFKESLKWDIKRIFKQIDDCLAQANVKKEDIELIILTGGSTEIPYIQKLISNYFPNATLSAEDKLSSVGTGLAYDSYRHFR